MAHSGSHAIGVPKPSEPFQAYFCDNAKSVADGTTGSRASREGTPVPVANLIRLARGRRAHEPIRRQRHWHLADVERIESNVRADNQQGLPDNRPNKLEEELPLQSIGDLAKAARWY
jgi:hypothetical protein